MVLSMTAFGRGAARGPTGGLQVLLTSVNRKHLEVICQLPDRLAHWLPRVRRSLQQVAQRGAVTLSVIQEVSQQAGLERVLSRAKMWERISAELGPNWEQTLSCQLLTQDPVEGSQDDDVAELEQAFSLALQEAIERWLEARRQEGELLAHDLLQRLQTCQQQLLQLTEWAQRVRPHMQQRLQSMGAFEGLASEEQERLVREWVQLIDKADAAEEITRLNAHFSRLENLLHSKGPIGKELEFLFQELMREANTLTSKLAQVRWGSAEPIHLAVGLKTELERMREQSQNLE